MTYTDKLVRLRGSLSQREDAEAIGAAPSRLSMYEQGERVPSDQVKVRLAEFYKTSVGYIFFDEKTLKVTDQPAKQSPIRRKRWKEEVRWKT